TQAPPAYVKSAVLVHEGAHRRDLQARLPTYPTSRRSSSALSCQPSPPRASGSVSRAGLRALGGGRRHESLQNSSPVVGPSQFAAGGCILRRCYVPGALRRGGSS